MRRIDIPVLRVTLFNLPMLALRRGYQSTRQLNGYTLRGGILLVNRRKAFAQQEKLRLIIGGCHFA